VCVCLKKAIFSGRISKTSLKRCEIEHKLTTECGYKLVHSVLIGDIFDDVT